MEEVKRNLTQVRRAPFSSSTHALASLPTRRKWIRSSASRSTLRQLQRATTRRRLEEDLVPKCFLSRS